MKRAVIAVVLGVLWLATAAADPTVDGMKAWQAGDFSTARRLWQQASDAGDAQAMYLFSQLLERGEGGAADPEEALRWLRMSAQGGYAVAQFNLGNHYQTGEGVSQDLRQAAYWWRLAALQGLAQAQYNLGSLYYRGDAGQRDLEQAAWWYEQAAAQGSARAQQALAMLRQAGMPASDEEMDTPTAPSLPAALQGLAQGPEWLSGLPPTHYTVQVMATRDAEAIRAFLAAQRLEHPIVVYPFRRDGQTWYALLYGRFADSRSARQAMAELPKAIRANGPWLRQIGQLPAEARD